MEGTINIDVKTSEQRTQAATLVGELIVIAGKVKARMPIETFWNVTVTAAEEKPINMSVKITFRGDLNCIVTRKGSSKRKGFGKWHVDSGRHHTESMVVKAIVRALNIQ